MPNRSRLHFLNLIGPATPPASQEIYLINLPHPEQYTSPSDFPSHKIITFQFQRYHYDIARATFTPVFPDELELAIRVQRLREKPGRSKSFPYLLDAQPEVTFYTNVYQSEHNDPVLHMLQSNPSMIFRYKLNEGVGYLVHIGHNFPDIDGSSVIPLWRTALTQHRQTSS